ncbi:MAG: 16S rRNA (guanine(527)-N(7))-methyltransferase RsmG [Microcoleaceae cyanobacterium]
MLPELFSIWQETLNWQPTPQQQALFQQLYQGIVQGNKKLNLTRITQPEDFWEKHLWDSLTGISSWLNTEQSPVRIVDIGTGAGFPGLPVAIVKPQSEMTLLDSTRKKITFLDELITQLNLNNVLTMVGRAEAVNLVPSYEKYFDLALLRAVAAPTICAKYALPFLKTGGTAILYRGNWTVEEELELTEAAKKWGGIIESIHPFTTPLTHSVRHCVVLKKIKD